MSTSHSGELLSAYFDGDTSPEEISKVERLLEMSAESRRELDEIGELSSSLSSLPPQSAPDELAPSILNRIERETLLPPQTVRFSPSTRSINRFLLATSLIGTTAALLLTAYIFSRPIPNARQEVASNSSLPQRHARSTADRETSFELTPQSETKAAGGPAGKMIETQIDALSQSNLNGSRLRNVQIGDVIPYFAVSKGRVAVIEVTVIDVRKAVGATQVLLERNRIPQIGPSELGMIMPSAGPQKTPLFAVYVESTQEQLAESIKQLRAGGLLNNLRLRPPVEMSRVELSDGDTLLTKHRSGAKQKSVSRLRSTLDSNRNAENRAFQMLVNLYAESLGKESQQKRDKVKQAAPKTATAQSVASEDDQTDPAQIRVILVFQEPQPVEAPKPE